eukprot:41401-Chlamydomonas_euryale.AAC.1
MLKVLGSSIPCNMRWLLDSCIPCSMLGVMDGCKSCSMQLQEAGAAQCVAARFQHAAWYAAAHTRSMLH